MWHQFLSQFHFQQPLWLLLVLPLAGLSYLGWRGTRGRSHWSEVCDPELLPLLVREGRASSRTGLVLAMLVSLLLALAAAQPVWQKQPRPAFKQGGAVVIALDLSASMNATDIKPSRLQRARFKIEDLLSRMGDSQVALLVYAGDAFAVTPLTEDSDTVRAQLPAMVPEIMPAQGSRADRALQLAAGMLQQAGVQGGDILLVSDEVEPAQIASSLSRLREQGIKTSILAVGTEQGAPIPTAAGPLKDRQGQVILAKTSRAQMLEAASLGGGDAVFMSHDDRDLVRLIGGFDRGDKLREHTVTEVEHWVAEGPWLVLLALPLILPLFRRGLLQLMLPALLLIGFGTAPVAEAAPAERVTDSAAASGLWQQLWQTDDQRAARQYAAGDTSAAAQTFSDPRWKQLAQYESGDFDAALAALAAPETAADWYNRGNVLARKGELDSAIAAYDQALALQPDLADAEHNRSLLQQLKNQQQSQQSDKSDQGQSGQDKPNQEQASHEPQASDQNRAEQQNSGPNEQESQQQAAKGDNKDGDSQTPAQASGQSGEPGASAQNPSARSAEEQQQKQQAAEQLKQAIDQQLDRQQEQQTSGSQLADRESRPVDEAEQARQQLLNRIVDDPAGLWRRKFIYQYRQRSDQPSEEKQW